MINKKTKTIIVSILMSSTTYVFADEPNNSPEDETIPLGCTPYPICDIGDREIARIDENISIWSILEKESAVLFDK